ncbi:dihydrodipicolinate reductase [Actinomadura sp. KC06]|uniref:NAD(P)H-dependent amine dehydrogenase family protein n=1 Tax=Actinomadura sp. KC06 TaxID=2530369 RepID=UPI00104C577E|nr:dihydrodipicolinate reductase [Actinomadura sp. KC06]TDD25427.1 dihydrodipicolinate reductase [Actinomadura sp. KC06]
MSYLVGHWATGHLGRQSLRAIIEHPDLELVGVVVGDHREAGLDAAELAGTGRRTGVLATADPARLLALRPHVISHTACGRGRVVDEVCRILESGAGVVTNALPPKPSADPAAARRLRAACATGGAACLATGPGPMTDMLPLLLSGASLHLDGIKITEVMCYARRAEVREFGFGGPIGHRPPVVRPGVPTLMWGPMIRLIADQLAVPLDDFDETYELCPAPESFDVPAGRIAKGTTAGLRFQVSGMLGGRPVITVEHVARLREDLAPHWPAPPFGEPGGHRVEIAGEPPWRLDVASPGAADPSVPGTLATALRLVNAIPAVAEARPGLHTPLTLPPFTGRRRLRRATR